MTKNKTPLTSILAHERIENLHTPDCIRTFTGIYMNVFEPTLDMICIEDIAHSLAYQCRFGGHLPKFFSVAQHSCHCASEPSISNPFQALMHDASEAYLLDIPKPIKNRLLNYKEIEDNLMLKISEKFGFQYPLSKEIKMVDEAMLNWEWETIMLKKGVSYCWDRDEAEREFLKSFYYFKNKQPNEPSL